MKTKKVKKVITTLKDRIGHPSKRHLTEISTRVNNLKSTANVKSRTDSSYRYSKLFVQEL